MKKILISILLPMLYLSSCATDPMKETRDELEIRKAETPEQTVIRQNETIVAIKKQIAGKKSEQQIRLNIPDTCQEINEQIDNYLDKLNNVANTNIALKSIDIDNLSQENVCTFCRSKDFRQMLDTAEKVKDSMHEVVEQKFLGLSEKDGVSDVEQQYITRLTQLCAQENTRNKFADLSSKVSKENKTSQIYINLRNKYKVSIEAVDNMEKELNKLCAEYDINNLKNARQAVQEKYNIITNDFFMAAVASECKQKFWKASNKQCSCYARAYFDEMKKLQLKVISEKEQCRIYQNDFAGVQVEVNARKRCGL